MNEERQPNGRRHEAGHPFDLEDRLQNSSSAQVPRAGNRLLTGLLGRNIQLSRSPQMHQDEAQAQGLLLEYRLFDFAALDMDVGNLPVFIEALEGSGYSGINVTHPYKQAVVPLLDELTESASRLGAVNTIAFREGRRCGFNTDVTGFAESMRRGLPDARRSEVFQAGAGGGGAATAHAILALGAEKLSLFDPDMEKAERLAESLCQAYGPGRAQAIANPAEAMATADGMINSTPIGMAEHPGSPVPLDLLSPEMWVADIVYFPLETELLRHARAIGCPVLDGGGMAVYQAAGAFEIFTGRPADSARMRANFLASIS